MITAKTIADILNEPVRKEEAKRVVELYLNKVVGILREFQEKNPLLPFDYCAIGVDIKSVSESEKEIKIGEITTVNKGKYLDLPRELKEIDWSIFSDSKFFLEKVIEELEERKFLVLFSEKNAAIIPLIYMNYD